MLAFLNYFRHGSTIDLSSFSFYLPDYLKRGNELIADRIDFGRNNDLVDDGDDDDDEVVVYRHREYLQQRTDVDNYFDWNCKSLQLCEIASGHLQNSR